MLRPYAPRSTFLNYLNQTPQNPQLACFLQHSKAEKERAWFDIGVAH